MYETSEEHFFFNVCRHDNKILNAELAMAANAKEKEPVNIVHRNAIFCETIQKEQRHQKLYTNYGVNPYKKSKNVHVCCQPLPLSCGKGNETKPRRLYHRY